MGAAAGGRTNVDWYLAGTEPDAVADLRREVGDHLRRHAVPGSDVDGAELAVSELRPNTPPHAPGPAWVQLDWSRTRPILSVHDLGAGFELDADIPGDLLASAGAGSGGGHGLFIVSNVAARMTVAPKPPGGSKVTAELPVARAAEPDHDPPRRRAGASLPTPQEALPDGTFGKESFLRALVVQL